MPWTALQSLSVLRSLQLQSRRRQGLFCPFFGPFELPSDQREDKAPTRAQKSSNNTLSKTIQRLLKYPSTKWPEGAIIGVGNTLANTVGNTNRFPETRHLYPHKGVKWCKNAVISRIDPHILPHFDGVFNVESV